MCCSSKPVAKKKEYVVPLIRKIVWRGLNNDNEGDSMSVNESVKSEAELALDKEAAEAIMSGTVLGSRVNPALNDEFVYIVCRFE